MSLARSVGSGVARTVAKPVNEAGVSGSIPGFDFIGANALGAYDIAPLKSGVTRCFRVRRSSDNTEQDCLTVAEAVTFCGAGSGFITTWYDQNGSSNLTQATTTQQPRIVNAGVADTGALFDGVNDFATLGATLTVGSMMTACCWLKFTGTAFNFFMGSYRTDNNQRGWQLVQDSNFPGVLTVILSADGTTSNIITVRGNTTINDDAWHFVCVTFTAGTIALTVDAIIQTLTTTASAGTVNSIHNSTQPFVIGAQSVGGVTPTGYYTGSLRDIRVYNVAKSASEIAAIYASVTP